MKTATPAARLALVTAVVLWGATAAAAAQASLPGEGGAVADEEAVWITAGEDAWQALLEVDSFRVGGRPLVEIDRRAGVVLTRARAADLPAISGYLHGALVELCELYGRLGVDLGELRPVTPELKRTLAGEIVLCPPGATSERWARGFPEPLTGFASGWMCIRQRARQRGVELPLILSDHADWDELTETIEAVEAAEVWVTHGREDALVHHAATRGIRARALSMVGFEEEGE